jgi:hypothetical protein
LREGNESDVGHTHAVGRAEGGGAHEQVEEQVVPGSPHLSMKGEAAHVDDRQNRRYQEQRRDDVHPRLELPFPMNRRGVGQAGDERDEPEGHQQGGRGVEPGEVHDVAADRRRIQQEVETRRRGVDEGYRMAESDQGEQDGQPRTMTSAGDASVEKADEQHGQAERDAEAELTGERARDVAAPHRVSLIEQKQQAGGGADGRNGEWIRHRSQAQQRRQGKQEDAEDGHELEGDVERHHPGQGDDEEGRRKEIRPVWRVAAEVARVPALRVARGQQHVAQMLDGMVERRRVAARGHGVEEQERGPEIGEEQRPDGEEHEERDGIGRADAFPPRGRGRQSARRYRHQASRATSQSMPGACFRRLTDESSLCTSRTG